MPPPALPRLATRPLALAALVLCVGAAAAEPRGSGLLPWYTEAQADIGRTTFIANCVACHGTSMFGIFHRYSTVERYFNFISGSMPKHLPGSLPEEDYLSIVAFLLRASGFKPGDVELTSERARLRRIVPAEGL